LEQLSVPGQKLLRPRSRLIGNSAQHVGGPSPWVDVVEPGGRDRRVHCGRTLAAPVGAGEQPCSHPMAKNASMRRTALLASGAFRGSANSKSLRRSWRLQHAAWVTGPGLRLPSWSSLNPA
jgi:hypothetical protein